MLPVPLCLMPRFLQSAARRLQCNSALRSLGIRVLSLEDDWRRVRIVLPLRGANINPGGSMFGGAIAALADPIPALACARVFPGSSVWTRAMTVDFRREARTDLELRFDLAADQEHAISVELAQRGRATPAFEFGFYDDADRVCVWVRNTVAIRPAGYRPVQRRNDYDEDIA